MKTKGVAMDINEENHQRFLQHLDESADGVLTAIKWLNKKGYSVTLPPVTSSEKYADRMKHVDGGDLFIQQRVEVKVRGIDFTCEADYPFKDGVYVCAQHSFDNAVPKPYAYILMNRAMTHAAIVMGASQKQWAVKEVQDSRYKDYAQKTYVCPLSAVHFSKM